MGWWSSDVLGGDTPLDILAGIEDAAGVETGALYPLDTIDEPARSTLRVWCDSPAFEQTHNDLHAAYTRDDQPIVTQVIAAVALAAGATIPEWLDLAARAAVADDVWAAHDEQRRRDLGHLTRALDTHQPPTPTILATTGLFEQIANHLQ